MLAERKAARPRRPVYMYSLDWRSPACDGRLKAHHAMDLPFVFDNTDVPDTTAGAPGARELAASDVGDLGRLRPQRQPGKPGNAALARLHAAGARDDGPRHANAVSSPTPTATPACCGPESSRASAGVVPVVDGLNCC